MRSRRHFKASQSSCRHRVTIKHNKFRNPFGNSNNVTIFDLDNINEVLRVHKTQRAEGKGAWKIVPKDSCEVYKNRRSRQAANRQNDKSSLTTDSESKTGENKRSQRRKRPSDKKVSRSAVRRRKKAPKRRQPQESSTSSSITTSLTNSSCFSSSEMDYE